MKPGDLVRLAPNRDYGYRGSTVDVAWWFDHGGERHAETIARESSTFPEGTLAVFLRQGPVSPRGQHGAREVSFILIEGRIGWVWPGELAIGDSVEAR